ncbi:MAG: isoprenyl transferase [bacterium]
MSIKESIQKIDKQKIPSHVAIIMDGNGRWAKKHGLPRILGHRKGVKRVKEVVEASNDIGIKVLTLYAFSTENWNRPKREIDALMKLLVVFLKGEIKNLMKNRIRMVYSGDITQFPEKSREVLMQVVQMTKNNERLILNLALNYGGRDEIVMAVNAIVEESLRENQTVNKKITKENFEKYLYTASMPDPDLLIRTSGEVRISNFLLWQIAYTELYFTPVLWPDFSQRHFLEALVLYGKRQRRFGGI